MTRKYNCEQLQEMLLHYWKSVYKKFTFYTMHQVSKTGNLLLYVFVKWKNCEFFLMSNFLEYEYD